jgi:hypothetical protein
MLHKVDLLVTSIYQPKVPWPTLLLLSKCFKDSQCTCVHKEVVNDIVVIIHDSLLCMMLKMFEKIGSC